MDNTQPQPDAAQRAANAIRDSINLNPHGPFNEKASQDWAKIIRKEHTLGMDMCCHAGRHADCLAPDCTCACHLIRDYDLALTYLEDGAIHTGIDRLRKSLAAHLATLNHS